MKIEGSFVNRKGDVVKVTITISSSTASDITIEPDGVLEFAVDDTVSIDSGVNDSLDVCQQHSCTINLHTREYVAALFTKEYKDGKVEVFVNDACVFSGWLEPRTLSQPFNEVYDDLSLQCVDSLSAMQYSNYKDVTNSTTYNSAARGADMRTFRTLLMEALNKGTDNGSFNVWWDDSKSVSAAEGGSAQDSTTGGSSTNIFDELQVSDMAFLGDSADDTVTYLEVAEAVLKFMDLHIVMYGHDFYIFSWETMRAGTTQWTLLSGSDAYSALPSCTGVSTGLVASNVEDMDTQLDIQEIFNQLCLTVSPKGSDTIMDSPLDSTVPAMGARQYYITEYCTEGEGITSARAFYELVKNHNDNGYDASTWKDYVVRLMKNVHWKVGSGSGIDTTNDALSTVSDWATEHATNALPEDVTDKLHTNLGALLLQVGNVDHKPGKGDTSKQATISMSDQLVISVNGNENDTAPYPDDTDIKAAMPLMSYEGGSASTVYSPSVADGTDGSYHNYLVIQGTIVLAPIMTTKFVTNKVRTYGSSDAFYNNYSKDNGISGDNTKFATSYSVNRNGNTCYLGFDWWRGGEQTGFRNGWVPNTDDWKQSYEYKTSDGKDTVEKVQILWCMMRIGDKVLVEDFDKNGEVSAFSWQTYKKPSECASTDDYFKQTFTIGIDPKIGDKLIGNDFDIATNFDYTTNIDADKGMAIPLPYSANLHGKMSFYVLGVDCCEWADYHVTKHHTMFRHSKWGTTNVPLMAHVSSVIVKDFSVKIYSDVENGGDDDDIVYMSRTSHKFYNKKDDLEMLIHSGFTGTEISQYGLSGKIMYTTVCGKDGLGVTAIYNKATKESDKAEKLYVDAYYKELSKPRIVLTQNMQCIGMGVTQTTRWTHPALSGKTFYVRDIGWNLMEGSAQVKMEESF